MELEKIKKLRDMTGAGVGAIKAALADANGDEESALKILRQKGMAKADKRKDRSATNGVLGVYVHANKKVVVVVEVNCETDFAAKSADMIKFANDIALQVAAMNPKFVNIENIDTVTLEAEKDTYIKELEGKPEEVKAKIMEGKMQKLYSEIVLMNQKLFIDDSKTVSDYLNEMVSKIGEKIEVKGFAKFEVSQPALISNI